MHIAQTPEEAIRMLDDAFNAGDLDAIMNLYDDAALVVPQPGPEWRGKAAIRELYEGMLQSGSAARQEKTCVLESDGVALFISRWHLSRPGEPDKTHIATTVLRKQNDGGWKAFIDNAQGPAILD